MKVYTYTEARQNLARLLDEARAGEEIRIRRRDGTVYALRLVSERASPLDVPPVAAGVSRDELLEALRESRAGEAGG